MAAVVADSGYAKLAFLLAFLGLVGVCVLVRVPNHRVLYASPPPVARDPVTGKRLKRGRPPVHGAKFSLFMPSKEKVNSFSGMA